MPLAKHLIAVLTMLLLLSVGLLASIAQDSTDDNLRIAFVSNRDGNDNIYLMLPDGSNQVPVTTDNARDWNPAWSPDGSQIIFNSDRGGSDSLYLMNFDGTNLRPLFPGQPFNDYEPAWSPDGRRIAFVSDRANGRELFVVDVTGQNLRQLTDDGRLKGDPAWSPDSSEIVYWQLENEGDILMFRRQVDSDLVQLITAAGPANGAPVWVGDSIFFDTNRDGLWHVYRMSADGASPRRISQTGFNSGRATISPDNQRIAFVTDRDEQDSDEIYVSNIDGSVPRRLTENGFSDHSPAWQPAAPPDQAPPPTAQPLAESTEEADDSETASTGPALGLNVSGVVARPITKERLLIDYGIREWHVAGWTGAGQHIGVIDTAFGGIDQFIDQFAFVNLPPGVAVTDYSLDRNDHGRDVLEVVHTVAPAATLYACRYQGTIEELRGCVNFMRERGVRIINHSVGLPILPLDGRSEWAELVNETFREGVLWVNSSGNFQRGFVEDNFDDGDQDGYHDWLLADGTPQELVISASEDEPYSGTILLSWQSPGIVFDPATGLQGNANLDLEIVSRVRPSNPDDFPNDPGTFGVGNRDQFADTSLPLFEIVYVENITEPFSVRVRNAGPAFPQRPEFSVFVEFAQVSDNWRSLNGSVVAPSDAANSLTVGSVDGGRDLASYSSFGAVGTTDLKPDIAAPGEIYMADGSTFIGTSAAAPVVAGIAALLLEADEGLRVDQLPREFDQIWRVPEQDAAFGAGIVQLSAPRARQQDGARINTPPFTVFPRPDEQFVNLGFSCPAALPSRFELEMSGYVNFDQGLAIRDNFGQESTELTRLDFGQNFTVIGGPECTGSTLWWLIELPNGADGWVSEGIGYYLITPVSLESARLPNTSDYEDTVCPNALDPQLSVGDRARLLVGGRFFFRGEGGNQQMDPLDADTIVEVLGGPTCEGLRGNELRWYIRVISGDSDQVGHEGWLTEGGTESRNLVPIADQ